MTFKHSLMKLRKKLDNGKCFDPISQQEMSMCLKRIEEKTLQYCHKINAFTRPKHSKQNIYYH